MKKFVISIVPAICYWIIFYYYKQAVSWGVVPSGMIVFAWIVGSILLFLAHFLLHKEGNKFIWIIAVVGLYLGGQTIAYWKEFSSVFAMEMITEGPVGRQEVIYFKGLVDHLTSAAIVVNLVNLLSGLLYGVNYFMKGKKENISGDSDCDLEDAQKTLGKQLKQIAFFLGVIFVLCLSLSLKKIIFPPAEISLGQYSIEEAGRNHQTYYQGPGQSLDSAISELMREFDVYDQNSVRSVLYDINNDGSDEIIVCLIEQAIDISTPTVLGIFDAKTGEKIVSQMIYENVSGFSTARLIANPTYGNCIAILSQYRANTAEIYTLIGTELMLVDSIYTYGELEFNEFVADIDADGYEEFNGFEPENINDADMGTAPYYKATYKWDGNKYRRFLDKTSRYGSDEQEFETNGISEYEIPTNSEYETENMEIGPLNIEKEFTTIAGISFSDTKQEVIEFLGNPIKSEETGVITSTFYYSFGEIDFYDDYVAIVKITDPSIAGLRGIKLGDSIDTVIGKFPNDNYPIENIADYHIQYLYKEVFTVKLSDGTEFEEQIGSGHIHYDENGIITGIYYRYDANYVSYMFSLKINNGTVSEMFVAKHPY